LVGPRQEFFVAIAKPRVHEIAKELGIPSKDLITKLNELGEYVKGPSSPLEAPVVG
jgi:translation initiation factor IF-2